MYRAGQSRLTSRIINAGSDTVDQMANIPQIFHTTCDAILTPPEVQYNRVTEQSPAPQAPRVVLMSKEHHPKSDQSVGQLQTSNLRRLEADCAETINEICRAMADQPEVALAIRQLMQANDTESELDSLRQSNPAAAKRLVVAAVGVLVNSINLVGIQDELQRRAREAN